MKLCFHKRQWTVKLDRPRKQNPLLWYDHKNQGSLAYLAITLLSDVPGQRCIISALIPGHPRGHPPLHPRPKVTTRLWPRGCWPTSQGGRNEEVGAVLFDDGVDELLSGGSPAKQADAPLKLRHEGHWMTDQVSPLDGCVPHLPTGKLPGQERWVRLFNLIPLPQAKVYPTIPYDHPSVGERLTIIIFNIC